MSALKDIVAGPAGAYLAISGMVIATFLCRIGGVLLMSRVKISPPLERALRALPGSIVMATVLPLVISSGTPAIVGMMTAIGVMWWTRMEIMALIAGLAAITILRLFLPV